MRRIYSAVKASNYRGEIPPPLTRTILLSLFPLIPAQGLIFWCSAIQSSNQFQVSYYMATEVYPFNPVSAREWIQEPHQVRRVRAKNKFRCSFFKILEAQLLI